MKESNKPNPQYTNVNLDGNVTDRDQRINKEGQHTSKESSQDLNPGKGNQEVSNYDKRLEDKPGAYLLKETAEDENVMSNKRKIEEERDDLNEDITEEDNDDTEDDMFNDDELYLEPFDDEDNEPEE